MVAHHAPSVGYTEPSLTAKLIRGDGTTTSITVPAVVTRPTPLLVLGLTFLALGKFFTSLWRRL